MIALPPPRLDISPKRREHIVYVCGLHVVAYTFFLSFPTYLRIFVSVCPGDHAPKARDRNLVFFLIGNWNPGRGGVSAAANGYLWAQGRVALRRGPEILLAMFGLAFPTHSIASGAMGKPWVWDSKPSSRRGGKTFGARKRD